MKQRWDKLILRELSAAFDALDETQVEALIDELLKPGRRVLCVGVGRVLISMKAWVKRLRHMNIDLNYVGAESEEPIGRGDLLIVASASGESLFPSRSRKKRSGSARRYSISAARRQVLPTSLLICTCCCAAGQSLRRRATPFPFSRCQRCLSSSSIFSAT